jgi:hypothetical protein
MLSAPASRLTSAALVGAIALTALAASCAAARGQTTATIAPSLSPDRLGARAALTFTINYTSSDEFGVPAPVRRSVLRFPAGLELEIPRLRSCDAARLRARGPSGCPAQSELGSGHALMEAHAGTENTTEEATLWAFLGPPRNLRPSIEIVAQGYTPLDERFVFSSEVSASSPPYGEQMTMSIPPIPTLVFEPDASVVSFSLTLGSRRRGAHADDSVRVPSRCPAGGLPFAAEFSYADGSTSQSRNTIPCP